MVESAQRYCELIRHPSANRARLRKPDMMGLARLPAADRTGLAGNKAQMTLVAVAPGLRSGTAGLYLDSQSCRGRGSRPLRMRRWLRWWTCEFRRFKVRAQGRARLPWCGGGQGIDFGLQHLHPLTEGGFDNRGILRG